jgi:hypothetical protein
VIQVAQLVKTAVTNPKRTVATFTPMIFIGQWDTRDETRNNGFLAGAGGAKYAAAFSTVMFSRGNDAQAKTFVTGITSFDRDFVHPGVQGSGLDSTSRQVFFITIVMIVSATATVDKY